MLLCQRIFIVCASCKRYIIRLTHTYVCVCALMSIAESEVHTSKNNQPDDKISANISHDRLIICFAKAFVGRGRFFATLQCSLLFFGHRLTKPFAHTHTINTQAQQVITIHVCVCVSMYDVLPVIACSDSGWTVDTGIEILIPVYMCSVP